MKKYGGHLELTYDWAARLLKSMGLVKRKHTTGKLEPSEKFLQEKKFSYQHEISPVVTDHNIPLYLILNLYQTPLSYVSLSISHTYMFCLKRSTTVPLISVNDKRKTLATFTVSAASYFLPVRLM